MRRASLGGRSATSATSASTHASCSDVLETSRVAGWLVARVDEVTIRDAFGELDLGFGSSSAAFSGL